MMTTEHNAHLIANFILYDAERKLTPLQLNKLIYFSHGWMLGLYDKPLITEQVEAWKYGPVIPSIYYLFKNNGREPINFIEYFDYPYANLNAQEIDIIRQVIDAYGDLSGEKLIELTHEKGTPWSKYYNGSNENVIIPNKAIKKYFKSLSDNG